MNEQFRNPSEARSHVQLLDRLAEVAVRVGLGLKAGQELVITAPLEAVPLARRITEHAYRAGATLVTTFYSDEEATLIGSGRTPVPGDAGPLADRLPALR